jgi:hypothetical protein
MPVVPYYQGHPAITWITAMSGPARAAANPADGTSPASLQPAAPATQQSASAGTSARAAASISGWEAWAANWFTPDRRPSR